MAKLLAFEKGQFLINNTVVLLMACAAIAILTVYSMYIKIPHISAWEVLLARIVLPAGTYGWDDGKTGTTKRLMMQQQDADCENTSRTSEGRRSGCVFGLHWRQGAF